MGWGGLVWSRCVFANGLLFFVAELQKRRAKHPEAEREQRLARLDAAHFLLQHAGLRGVETTTAIFLRPLRRGPPFFGHSFQPDLGIWILECLALAAPDDLVFALRCAHGFRGVFLEPGLGLLAKNFQNHRCLGRFLYRALKAFGRFI